MLIFLPFLRPMLVLFVQFSNEIHSILATIHISIYISIYMYINIYLHKYIYVHTCIYRYKMPLILFLRPLQVFLSPFFKGNSFNTANHSYIYIHINIYVHKYIHIYINTHRYMHIQIDVAIFTFPRTNAGPFLSSFFMKIDCCPTIHITVVY